MKILVMSSQSKNTGSTLRAEYIYKYLKKAGADADYITPPVNSMPFMFDFILALVYNFFKILNKKYDLVFIVKPYPNTVWPATLLKMRGAKIVIDIDDMDYGYRKSILSGFIKKLQSSLVKNADYLTSHNEELIKLIKKEYPKFSDKIYRLNQCVDMELFKKSRVNKAVVKKIRSVYKDKKILFYTAHLNIASYLDSILDSIVKIDNIVLIIAGGGPMENYYKKSAAKKGLSDKVIFLGQLKQLEIINYIGAADICLVYYNKLLVNKYRASMKLREYLAMGKSVVANNVGEIKSFQKYIFMSGSGIKQFSSEIKKRIIKVDKRCEKGYIFIKQKYDWKNEIKGFLKFLKEDII